MWSVISISVCSASECTPCSQRGLWSRVRRLIFGREEVLNNNGRAIEDALIVLADNF